MAAQVDLAPTPIARLIKQTLPPVSSNPHSPDNYRVSKELKAGLQRAGGLFALYLAHTAQQVSRETGRQQVTPEDVLGALEELELDVLVQPTNDFVKAYRKAHLHKAGDEDLRPTRPSSGSGGSKKSSLSKRKASSSGGGSGKASGGSSSSGSSSNTSKKGASTASAPKRVKANVDLTAEAEQEGGADDEHEQGGEDGEDIEEDGQEAGD